MAEGSRAMMAFLVYARGEENRGAGSFGQIGSVYGQSAVEKRTQRLLLAAGHNRWVWWKMERCLADQNVGAERTWNSQVVQRCGSAEVRDWTSGEAPARHEPDGVV